MKSLPDVQDVVVSLLTLAALLLLAKVLVTLTWVLLAPPPLVSAPALAPPVVNLQAAYPLFGSASQNPELPVVSTSGISLLGIVAAAGQEPGFAVVRLETGTTVAVREGEEIAPGVILRAVESDHLQLEREGQRENLPWPQR